MKKKIIKFCFSKWPVTPGTTFWFFLSRSYRNQSRRNKYDLARVKRLRQQRKLDLIENAYNFYKYNTKRGPANYYILNKKLAPAKFSKSYFLSSLFIKKHRNFFPKIQNRLLLWQKLKKKILRRKIKKFKRFKIRKILTLHLDFFIFIKTRMYHSMFKYKSRCFNSTHLSSIIYLYSVFLYTHVKLLKQQLYFFTANSAKKNCHYDMDFIFCKATWGLNLGVSKKIHNKISLERHTSAGWYYNLFINPENYNYLSINILKTHLNKLRKFRDETDKIKKEASFAELIHSLSQTHDDAVIDIINIVLSYNIFSILDNTRYKHPARYSKIFFYVLSTIYKYINDHIK